MRVLVTGSSGFIGPSLVKALIERGDYVVGIDRVRPSSVEPHAFVHGDLLDDGPLDKALAHDVDLVAHLAAARTDWGLSPDEYERDNVTATRRLIELAGEVDVHKWLFYSSVGVLGSGRKALDDSSPHAPENAYGQTKASAEDLFVELGDTDPTAEVMIVRPSAVYGPGNPPDTNVFRLIDAVYRRRFLMIGHGDNVKTVSYLPNLIEATIFLIEQMKPGVDRYIYVDTPPLTTSELVALIYKDLERHQPRWRLPLGLARAIALPSDLAARLTGVDLPITSARISKFCKWTNFDRSHLDRLGFSPSIPIQDAVAATVEWYLGSQGSS